MTAPDARTTPPALGDDLHRIDRIADAFAEALEQATATPTSFKDSAPVPAVGSAPPVPQPGRPPMSQKAVDVSTIMLSAGAASLPLGAVTIGVMLASGHADPVVVGLVCATPLGLAGLVLALGHLARRAKEVVEAAPPVHHHHYSGQVRQETHYVKLQGVYVKNVRRD